VTAEQLRELMDVALSSPRERGLPFSVWSVPKLAAYCRKHDLIPPFCDGVGSAVVARRGDARPAHPDVEDVA